MSEHETEDVRRGDLQNEKARFCEVFSGLLNVLFSRSQLLGAFVVGLFLLVLFFLCLLLFTDSAILHVTGTRCELASGPTLQVSRTPIDISTAF